MQNGELRTDHLIFVKWFLMNFAIAATTSSLSEDGLWATQTVKLCNSWVSTVIHLPFLYKKMSSVVNAILLFPF